MSPRLDFDEHPLDFDWRFSVSTRERLAEQIAAYRRPLLLGVPTVALELQAQGRGFILADRQPLWRQYLPSQVVVDISASHTLSLPAVPDVVLIDPPWYPDETMHWINVALRSTRYSVPIWVATWTQTTRANGATEQQELLTRLSRLGAVTLDEATLSYDTPLFEQRLRTPGFARRGSLIRFRATARRALDPVRLQPKTRWIRFAFGKTQVAVRTTPDSDRKPSLRSPYRSGDWFQRSVSRRDRTRSSVDLWRSDGFVASLGNRGAFIEALFSFFPEAGGRISKSAEIARDLLVRSKIVEDVHGAQKPWRHREWTSFA